MVIWSDLTGDRKNWRKRPVACRRSKCRRFTSNSLQFADVKDAWGKVSRTGQTFTWDVVPMMTRGNRALSETNTIPAGQHTIIQGTLTVSERGFSVPYTEMVEALSKFSVRNPIMKVLKYDAACDLDALAHQQFKLTALRYSATSTAPGALTSNSTASHTTSQAMSTTHLKDIVDKMKERNIPYYFDTGDYAGIARPTGLRAMKNTLETLSQYSDSGFGKIMNGEVGRSAYENVRFIEQTSIPAGGASNSTTFDAFTDAADAWDTAGADWVYIFGEDTVAEAVETEEEIRIKESADFQRAKGVAWYALCGFGLVHNDSSNLAQSRIVMYDSLA